MDKYKENEIVKCVENYFNEPDYVIGDLYTIKGVTMVDGNVIYSVLDWHGNLTHTMDKFEALKTKKPNVVNPPKPPTKVEMHSKLCKHLTHVYGSKNADYGDSFAIVRKKRPDAILIRVWDKVLRLETLLDGEKQRVLDESIDDTLLDLANYCLMEYIERKIDEEDNNG